MRDRELYYRLRSCLETILDLEGELEKCDLAHLLRAELGLLHSFMDNIPEQDLHEADVERVEAATAAFLKHLALPFQARRPALEEMPGCKRIQ